MFRYRNAKKFSLVSMYDSSVGWTNDSLKILDDDWMAHRMVSLREDVSDEEVYALIDMIIIKYGYLISNYFLDLLSSEVTQVWKDLY